MQSVKIRLGGSYANAHLDFGVPGVKKMWMSVSVNHAKMELPVKMVPIASGKGLSPVLCTIFVYLNVQSFFSLYGVPSQPFPNSSPNVGHIRISQVPELLIH